MVRDDVAAGTQGESASVTKGLLWLKRCVAEWRMGGMSDGCGRLKTHSCFSPGSGPARTVCRPRDP